MTRSTGTGSDSSVRDPVVDEAQKRYQRCEKWYSYANQLFISDLKFAEADSDNGYQWPDNVKNARGPERPSLTINETRQHNLNIINDMKQNKPGIIIRPTGNGATYEAAQAYMALIRHIEYQSNASVAYDTAAGYQVKAGKGYIRVITDYASDDTFDQEIYIRRIWDPLSVYIDPDAKELDRSDARFALIFDTVPKDEFDQKYPEYKDIGSQDVLGNDYDWVTPDHVRVCEYFTKEEDRHTLFAVTKGDGEVVMLRDDELPKELLKEIKADPNTVSREIVSGKIKWYFIVGNQIVESKDWPGKYIPIVPVIGEESIIDGTYDCKGHTRAMKDPQRMYNYWSSSAVEYGALQGKTPWIAAAEAIEQYESMWNTANTVNHSVLIYNGMDDQGNAIAPPARTQPPVAAPVALSGMQIAQMEMMRVSGQYESQLGEQGNERTGAAITGRQRQGDTATYHFTDNLGTAISHVGRICLDLIPHIYDTQRVLMVMAEDGTDYEIEIDPQAKQAFAEELNHDQEVAKRILNPLVGRFEVEASVGPGYATKRQEAFQAISLLLTQAPELVSIVGDLLMKAGDFPMADEIAQRLRRMVPPQALGQGPSQTEQQLTEQVATLKGVLTQAMDELAKAQLELKGKGDKVVVDQYNAETKRMAAVSDIGMTDTERRALALSTIKELLEPTAKDGATRQSKQSVQKTVDHTQMTFDLDPPVGGAKKAPDGHWYVDDPRRPGKYMQVHR